MKAITGTLDQCVADFAHKTGLGKFQHDHGITRQDAGIGRKKLAELFGLNPDTMYHWLNGALPHGEKLVRLIVLLEAAGYEVTQCKKGYQPIGKHQKHMMAAIAFSVIKTDELSDQAGFTSAQGLYDYMFGRNGIAASKKASIDEMMDDDMVNGVNIMLKKHGDEIRGITGIAFQKSAQMPKPAPVQSGRPESESPKQASMSVSLPTDPADIVVYLASLVMGALPLAAALLQDKSPRGAEFRNRLRELTRTAGGSNGVFDLSNYLNALCSEKARTATASQQ